MSVLFHHQEIGRDALVKWNDPATGRVYGGCFMLADEMGAGKTRQGIEAAQELFKLAEIDSVLVITPAPVRGVWDDPEFGQLREYTTVPSIISEYRAKSWSWMNEWVGTGDGRVLDWTVTNYEFIRRPERLEPLLKRCSEKTLLILDESTAVKSHRAAQTKAVWKLRRRCGRVILMSGTPVGDNPGDLYSQAAIMDPGILGCKNWFHFRARYGIMGGWRGKQIVAWTNLDDLSRKMAPYVLRRLKSECLDLPAKLPPVILSVPLSPATWTLYRTMRDDAVAYLSAGERVTAAQAITRVMRLAQLTAGFVGGVVAPDKIDDDCYAATKEVGREKLDLLLEWVADRLSEDRGLKLLVWCRFRAEAERAAFELGCRFRDVAVRLIYGDQKKAERAAGLALLNPKTAPLGPAILVGTTRTGSFGLDLQAAHTVVYLTNDYSLMVRNQSEDRVHRPGQTSPVSYFDVVATGPDGQRTVDHAILKALRKKADVAAITASEWAKELA